MTARRTVCTALAVLGLALVVPATAAAQPATANQFTLTVNDTGLTSYSFSRGDCEAETPIEIPFTWTFSNLQLLNGDFERVFVTTGSGCTPPTDDTQLIFGHAREAGITTRTVPDSTTRTTALTVPELFSAHTSGADCGGLAGIDVPIFLCVVIKGNNGTTDVSRTASIQFTADSKPPAVPTVDTVDPLENALKVTWTLPSSDDDATGFIVYYQATGEEEQKVEVNGASSRSTTLKDLKNNVAYSITVAARDAAGSVGRTATYGNVSERSVPKTGTPVPVSDFFEDYSESGGDELGGCASAGPALGLLVPLALALFRRRRAAAVALALVAAAPAARAETGVAGDIKLTPLRSERQTPQHFTLEVRTGPYTPNVDLEAGLTGTPYKTAFGSSNPFLSRVELTYDFLHTFVGRIGVGAAVGVWEVTGHGTYPDGQASSDVVTMWLAPVTALAAFRFDVLYDRFGFPVVPYLKLGYGFTAWNSKVNGSVSTIKNGDTVVGTAEGWARGLEFGGGLQLALDGLEPHSAAALDRDWGINSTLVFFEAQANQWTGKGGLRLDGVTFAGGIAISF